jgi:DNA replication protein DnaC
MLLEQTMEKLTSLRLMGMASALRQWVSGPRDAQLSAEDLIGLLADAEWIWRENNKLSSRLRHAQFKESACIEDIDYDFHAALPKTAITELASSRWIASHKNIIATGPTGAGKTFVACALGNKACRDGFTVLYRRATRLFDELAMARADGTFALLLRRLARTNVLIIDDFGGQALTAAERRDLLEVLDDRYGSSSTIITSQLEPDAWHAVIGDETLADSICDRLVHNAQRLRLKGESVRKLKEEKEQQLTTKKKSAK